MSEVVEYNNNKRLIEDANLLLVSDADVRVTTSASRKNEPVAVAEIRGRDQYGREFETEHKFPVNSRISKALEDKATPEQLSERMTGGHFFFVNDRLHDFRDGSYNGFVHSADSIEALKDTIGVSAAGRRERTENTQSSGVSLSRVWSSANIEVPAFSEGGRFDSRLTFKWSPFSRTINSAFEIVRLICANGMVGLTNLFSTKIPLENRWQEHIEIANAQLQNKISGMCARRFEQMAEERATVADCALLAEHAENRYNTLWNGDGERREILRNIMTAVSPEIQLTDYYKMNAIRDKRLAAQLPSHLTAFDAYNIATELASHTNEGNGSSNFGLDRFANQLVFDRADRSQHAARFGTGPQTSAFSDPDAAFFGKLN